MTGPVGVVTKGATPRRGPLGRGGRPEPTRRSPVGTGPSRVARGTRPELQTEVRGSVSDEVESEPSLH